MVKAKTPEWVPFDNASHPFIYGLSFLAVGVYLKQKYDIKVFGRENINHRRRTVVGPDHTRDVDPEVLGFAYRGKTARNCRAVPTMAKLQLWSDPKYKKCGIQLGNVLAIVDAFPVDRDTHDREAMRIARGYIKPEDGVVGIFPKGTRKEAELHTGPASFAYTYDAELQPMAIAYHPYTLNGEEKELIRVIIPRPLHADRSLRKARAVKKLTEELDDVLQRDHLRALGWAAFDAAQKINRTKKIGRIKRHA